MFIKFVFFILLMIVFKWVTAVFDVLFVNIAKMGLGGLIVAGIYWILQIIFVLWMLGIFLS